MAKPEGVDDAALGAVEPQGDAVVDLDRLPPDQEGVLVESMPADRRADPRGALGSRKGDVDRRGDDVRQVVNREGGREAERGLGSAERDLDPVEVGGRRIGLAIDPVPQPLEHTVLDVPLEPTVRQTPLVGEAVGEGVRERGEHLGGDCSHLRKTWQQTAAVACGLERAAANVARLG